MSYHKHLERQLKKITDSTLLSNEHVLHFVKMVNDSYLAFEKDKELSTRAFIISEKEYSDINLKLKEEIALRKLSIDKLKDAIKNLETQDGINMDVSEDNLFAIVTYLDTQINKRKEIELELVKAKVEAEKANSSKSEFLSIMSHEIRTPLHAVIGMGHLLMKDNPRADQLDHLKILRTASDNLLVLINDILDFSKIEAGKIDLEEEDFNIKHLMADIKLANSVRAQERGNEIKLMIDSDLPAIIKGDSVRIGQILTNLVSNAIKFTKEGQVSIQVMLQKMKGDEASIYFSVSDTGVGIAKENFDKIFSKFTQESSSITRQFGGTGLGLSITRKLLTLMNSEICLESELGKGSKFSFVLNFKVKQGAAEKTYESPVKNFDLQQVKILLVEDTPFNILYATQLIESWNASVDVAENGLIAVEKMKANEYQLVLMDLQMPVMDGYTAARTIREFNSNVPIIALTASATSNVKEKTFAAGMNDYVTKPFNPDDFYQRIRKYTH